MSATPPEPWTVRRRLVLTTCLVAAVVAVALASITHQVVDRTTRNVVSRVLDDRAGGIVDALEAAEPLPVAALGPGTAVYVDGELVAGSAPPSLRAAFERLSTVRHRRSDSVGEEYRLLAVPFDSAADDGTVVVAETLAPYERDERIGLFVASGTGAAMVLLASAVAAWISRRALLPVRQMADAAHAWSEHDLDRRFDLGPPTDELRALGQVLDELLEKVAGAIRAEQRLSAEMAHELRSPLTIVRGTTDLLAARDDLHPDVREDLRVIGEACRAMSATMTLLLDEARRAAPHGARAACGGEQLAEGLRTAASDPGRLDVDIPPELELRVPAELVVRILTPLIDNGLRMAEHVRVGVVAEGSRVGVTVSDDGPGVAPEMAGRIFEPGVSDGGSGLGLALARRLARGAGGDVVLVEPAGRSGAAFVVWLPGAISAER